MTDAQFPPVPPPPTSWVTGPGRWDLPPQMPSLAALNAPAAPPAAQPLPGAEFVGQPQPQYAPQWQHVPQPQFAPNQYAVESRPVTVPTLAALVPFAGLLAVVGAFVPWFSPSGSLNGVAVLHAQHALYSWKDGRSGLIAPIALSVIGLGVIALMRGNASTRFQRGANPLSSAGNRAMVVSAISAVGLGFAAFLIPHQYRIPLDAGGSWDGAARMGIDMTRGPQLGFYLTIAAVVLAFVGGVALKRAGRRY